MSLVIGPTLLAQPGTTGNNTGAGALLDETADGFCVQFVVEAIGATPTVTWKAQVSLELPALSDANSNWTDLIYLTAATDTPAVAGLVVTTVSVNQIFADTNSFARWWRKVRLVTSANTNVTYRAELYSYRFRG